MPIVRAQGIAQGLSCLRAARVAGPIGARFVSNGPTGAPVKTSPSDAPTTPPKDSSLIRQEGPGEAMTRHQPDYNATIDHGTSLVPCVHDCAE